jgi:hypothetical protein
LKTAADFLRRALRAHGAQAALLSIRQALHQEIQKHFPEITNEGDVFRSIEDYPDRALVRREVYPWNPFEPGRYTSESLDLLNRHMQEVAPKLEVRVTELPLLRQDDDSSKRSEPSGETVKQLGVFAKEDLQPGEEILHETSLLTAHARLHDSFCDACSGELPPPPPPTSLPLDLDDRDDATSFGSIGVSRYVECARLLPPLHDGHLLQPVLPRRRAESVPRSRMPWPTAAAPQGGGRTPRFSRS